MPFTVAATANNFTGSAATTATISANAGDTIAVAGFGTSSSAGFGTVTDSAGNTYTIGATNTAGANLWGAAYILALPLAITSVTYTPPATIGGAGIFVWRLTATGIVQFADSKAPTQTTSTTGTNAISTGSMNVTSSDGILLSVCDCGSVGHLSIGTVPPMISDGTFIFGEGLAEHYPTSGANPATFTDSTAGDTINVVGLAFQLPAAVGIAWVS